MSEIGSDAITSDARTPGQVLAGAREACGMSVAEVATRLKYSPRQIAAIEEDRFDALPGAASVRGMIRAYAKLVGIDPAPLVTRLDAYLRRGPETVQPPNMDVPFETRPRRASLAYLLLSIVILLVVAGVVAEWLLRQNQPTPAAVEPAPATDTQVPMPAEPGTAPVPTPPAAEPVPSHAPQSTGNLLKRIELAFDEECWMEIRDGKGEILLLQLNAPGTQQHVEGIAPFAVVVGNVGGVRIRYDGTEVNLAPFKRTDVARLTLK